MTDEDLAAHAKPILDVIDGLTANEVCLVLGSVIVTIAKDNLHPYEFEFIERLGTIILSGMENARPIPFPKSN
jgi:hypothetical protein